MWLQTKAEWPKMKQKIITKSLEQTTCVPIFCVAAQFNRYTI